MELKKAALSDLKDLQEICAESYTQVFANHWTANGLALYLEQEFGTNRLQSELQNEDYAYHLIQENSTNIGFIKMNYRSSDELSEKANCELEKIYILPKHGGKGIGKMALDQVMNDARKKGKALLFLCVIDTNESAIRFYQKSGFEFHSKTQLDVPHFKEELRGMHRMCLHL